MAVALAASLVPSMRVARIKPATALRRSDASVMESIPVGEYLTSVYDPDVDYVDGELEHRFVDEKDHARVQRRVVRLLDASKWFVTGGRASGFRRRDIVCRMSACMNGSRKKWRSVRLPGL